MEAASTILTLLVFICIAGPAGAQAWPRVFEVANSSKIDVNVILVQPYSGGPGTVGYKIEPMIQLALEEIDAHPTVLPNHRIVFHAIDSGCSENQALDAIFNAHITGPSKFGVFGAACTGACKAASVMSRSFKTVNFAQLCTGTVLSDETLYPHFARFSPDLGKNSQTAVDLSTRFGWRRLALVMENVGLFVDMGERLAEEIRANSEKELVAFEKIFPTAVAAEMNGNIASVVDRLISSDVRVVIFIGYEKAVAQMLCEASRRGFVGGEVVFIYATFWIAKDWYQEFAVDTNCNQEQLLAAGQGLLGIDRLRLAPDAAGLHGGSRKSPSVIMQEYHQRCEQERAIPGDPSFSGCTDMHSAYTYDAAWGWAFTLDRWLRMGHQSSEVDYLNASARQSVYQVEVEQQDFQGLTGRVRHYENGDRDGELQLFQIQGDRLVLLASVVDQGATFLWEKGTQIYWGGVPARAFDPQKFNSADQWVPPDQPLSCPEPLTRSFNARNVIATETCVPCPGGMRWYLDVDAGAGKCLACDAGTSRPEASSLSECETCPTGTFANISGMRSCLPCPAGHVCEVGSPGPTPCALGEFAPGGSLLTQCVQCAEGTYADTEASSACRSCAELILGSTSTTAARSGAACLCPEGTYLLRGDPSQSQMRCVTCPGGMTCPFGSDPQNLLLGGGAGPHPLVSPGYMTLQEDPFEVFACASSAQCPGGVPASCAPLRSSRSVACGRCVDGAYQSQGECVDCGGGSNAAPLLITALLGVVALALLTLAINRDMILQTHGTMNLVCISGLTLSAVQTLGVFEALAIPWFEPAASVLDAMKLMSFNLEVLKASCVLGGGPVTQYVWRQVVIVMFGLVIFFAIAVKRLRKPSVRVGVEFCNTMGTVLNLFFTSIALACSNPWVCYSHPSGRSASVRSDPSVLCEGKGDHGAMIAISICALLAIVLPFLAMAVYSTARYSWFVSSLDENASAFLQSTRFLFMKFRPERYYFGLAVLLRSVLICGVPVAFRDEMAVQVLVLCAILGFYLQIQQFLCPWRSNITNLVDGALSLMMLLFVVSGALASSFGVHIDHIVALGTTLFVVMFACCLVAFCHGAWRLLQVRPYYDAFVCHHKADAAGQARLLKMMLDVGNKHNTFIDSDHLVDLDTLFDTVKSRVGRLIVYLTRETMTRPWCAGEIATASRSPKVRVVAVYMPCFLAPSRQQLDFIESYIDLTSCSLLKYGITMADIQRAFNWFLGDAVPRVQADSGLRGPAFFNDLVNNLNNTTHGKEMSARVSIGGTTYPDRPGMVLMSVDPEDIEANAAAIILGMKIKAQVLQFAEEGVCNLAVYDPADLKAQALVVAKSRAVLVMLSRGTMESIPQLVAIVEAASASCEDAIPICTPSFTFPSPRYYTTTLHKVLGSSSDVMAPGIQSFFRIIAVTLSIAASDQIIQAQAESVIVRVPKAFDMANSQRKSFLDEHGALESLTALEVAVEEDGFMSESRSV